MMKIPKRLLVLQRLTTLLEQTTYEFNGQQLSLKGAVFRGRNLIGEESKPWPAVSILESPQPDTPFFAGTERVASSDRWTLLLQGIAENDMLNPSDAAYYLYAAVELQLHKIIATKSSGSPAFPEHHLLGSSITGLETFPPVVRPPDDKASAAAFFFLPVRVGIATLVGQPYTQVS